MSHWPNSLRPLSLLLAGALLTACGGSPINQDNFNRIETGMTLEEVQTILGKPTESSSASFGTISGGGATWSDDDDDVIITVQFVNDKVQFKQFSKNPQD